MPVSGTKVDLTAVTVTGYDKNEGSEDEVFIQSLDASGRTVPGSVYFWIDVIDGEDVYLGWMNEAGDLIEEGDVEIAPGEGIWVKAPSASYSLQFSGQVPTSDISNLLREGFKLIANPTPIAVDLTGVTVEGYDPEEGSEDEVFIQSLDASGQTVPGSVYFWIDVTDGEDVYYGWMNEAGDLIEEGDASIGAGEGVWVKAPSTAFKVVFPGVELN